MPFADNGGVRLHWQGRGTGSPLLLVMGHRFSSAMWYPILPALTAAHHTVWFDNRGTGESDAPRKFSVRDMAEDAFAVMDAAGLERAHVFGVSMGGGVALEMAIRRPERVISLVLGCTGMLTADKPRMPKILRLLYYLPPWLLRALMSGRRGDAGYGSAASKDKIAVDKAMFAKDRFSVPGVVAQAAAVGAYSVTREAVAALTMPSLVLHGDEDSAVPVAWGEDLAATLADSRFLKLAGAGHNFLIAARDEATTAVLDFIGQADKARQP